MKINRRVAIAGALVLLLALAGWWRFGGHEVPQGQPPLATVDAAGLESLRQDFNAQSDAARMIVLLSPS